MKIARFPLCIALLTPGGLPLCSGLVSACSFNQSGKRAIQKETLPLKTTITIPKFPASLQANNVSQSYPPSIMRSLFSCVSRRKFALKDVSVTFSTLDGVTLLLGQSGSGKSSLLRILVGKEAPISGTVLINGHPPFVKLKANDKILLSGDLTRADVDDNRYADFDPEECDRRKAQGIKPVIVNAKPVIGGAASVRERLLQLGKKYAGVATQEDESCCVIWHVVHDYVNLLGLNDAQLCGPPSALSPSGQLLFGIGCACIESMAPYIPRSLNAVQCKGVFGPVVLLDELLDFEHPSVSDIVGRGLWNVSQAGCGIVVAATHKPHQLQRFSRRRILLTGGTVLNESVS